MQNRFVLHCRTERFKIRWFQVSKRGIGSGEILVGIVETNKKPSGVSKSEIEGNQQNLASSKLLLNYVVGHKLNTDCVELWKKARRISKCILN